MFTKMLAASLFSLGLMAVTGLGQETVKVTQRIDWKTSVLDAFVEAVESNKPLVVVFLSNPAFRNAERGNLSNRQ